MACEGAGAQGFIHQADAQPKEYCHVGQAQPPDPFANRGLCHQALPYDNGCGNTDDHQPLGLDPSLKTRDKKEYQDAIGEENQCFFQFVFRPEGKQGFVHHGKGEPEKGHQVQKKPKGELGEVVGLVRAFKKVEFYGYEIIGIEPVEMREVTQEGNPECHPGVPVFKEAQV